MLSGVLKQPEGAGFRNLLLNIGAAVKRYPSEASDSSSKPDPAVLGPLAERLNRNKRILGLVAVIRRAMEKGNLHDLQARLNECLTNTQKLSDNGTDCEQRALVFDHLKHQLAKAGISASLIWKEPYDGNARVVLMSKDGLSAKVLTVSTDLKETPTAISYSPGGSARIDPVSALLNFKTLLDTKRKADEES